MTTKLTPLELEYKDTIYDKSKRVDPSDERDWYCMSYGWALGKGLSIAKSHKFAEKVTSDPRTLFSVKHHPLTKFIENDYRFEGYFFNMNLDEIVTRLKKLSPQKAADVLIEFSALEDITGNSDHHQITESIVLKLKDWDDFIKIPEIAPFVH